MAAEGNASQLVGVVTLLGAAVVAVPLFKRIGLGSVLGYLAAGLAIGPFGLALVTDAQTIIHVAELGVVMFLFVIGLEMKPSHLWGLRKQIFGLGSMQVVLAAIMLTFVGMAFGFSWQVSFVSGAGFVLTSTAIVMQVLAERGDILAPRGQNMVSILLFEDLLIVPLLGVVAFLAPASATLAPGHRPAVAACTDRGGALAAQSPVSHTGQNQGPRGDDGCRLAGGAGRSLADGSGRPIDGDGRFRGWRAAVRIDLPPPA